MADELTVPVDRLPTLTEVLDLGRELRVQPPVLVEPVFLQPRPLSLPVSVPLAVPGVRAVEAAAPPPRIDESALVERVLASLLPRIDGLLEARVSEALAPALARAADTLIRESRDELVRALRSLAEESLAQVLRQERQGAGPDDTQG